MTFEDWPGYDPVADDAPPPREDCCRQDMHDGHIWKNADGFWRECEGGWDEYDAVTDELDAAGYFEVAS